MSQLSAFLEQHPGWEPIESESEDEEGEEDEEENGESDKSESKFLFFYIYSVLKKNSHKFSYNIT